MLHHEESPRKPPYNMTTPPPHFSLPPPPVFLAKFLRPPPFMKGGGGVRTMMAQQCNYPLLFILHYPLAQFEMDVHSSTCGTFVLTPECCQWM